MNIGIGINVNDKAFADEIAHKATSLYLLSGKKYDVKDIFRALNKSFENVFAKYDFVFTVDAKREYEKLCANIGKNVTAQNQEGEALGVGEDGSLLVKTKDEIISISSGEVAVHNIY